MHRMVDLLCRHSRFHHQGRNVKDFSSQLKETNIVFIFTNPMSFMHLCSWNFNCCISVIILYTKLSCVTSWCWFTLQTTLMPSISSASRILIWDVPFMVCSDSDIPASSDELVNWWAVKYTDTHLPTKASYYHSNIWLALPTDLHHNRISTAQSPVI